jgi:KaiC/GvpD/RAD55 family RecA-like ATPase
MRAKQPPDGIILGFPFDHLMDRDCPLESLWPNSPGYGKNGSKKAVPGIKMPDGPDNRGTGNIVICGEPGTGKSTLALQFAVKCAMHRWNNSISAYIPLESTVQDVQAKADSFGWRKHLRPLQTIWPCDDTTRITDLKESLEKCLRTPLKEKTGCVIVPSLSPRHTRPAGAADLFWHRYQQLERLLMAGNELQRTLPPQPSAGKEPEQIRRIFPIVVLDSLNMFGFDSLTRDQGYMLFRLFHRFKRIGIFVVETSTAPLFDSTMADVVIRLSATKDQDYFVRHLEIEKSRFFNQINGLHPFRTERPRIRRIRRVLLIPQFPYRFRPCPQPIRRTKPQNQKHAALWLIRLCTTWCSKRSGTNPKKLLEQMRLRKRQSAA